MKYWNNKKHEKVLEEKREKKRYLKLLRDKVPNYNTCCDFSNNNPKQISTDTAKECNKI